MELEYSGDFASFDCSKCFYTNRIIIKDGVNNHYFCSYCGIKDEVEEK